MPTVKKEVLEEAVGDALDSFFASIGNGGGDVTAAQPTMSFVPNADGSVTISDPPDRQAAADYCASWDAFEREQQLPMMENEAAACMKSHCYHCGRNPCATMQSEYDTIIKIGDSMHADGASNKAIRFALYRHMSSVFHGHLGAGKREALPACIMGDICDAYPKEEGTEYVGFKPKKTED